MSKIYGYVKSAWYQVPEEQMREIEIFCKERKLKISKIFNDVDVRSNYEILKEKLCPYDILIITNIQALGENSNLIMRELVRLKNQHVRLINLEIPETTKFYEEFDYDIAQKIIGCIANMYIEMYASMIEAEKKKRKDAQRAGIERKKRYRKLDGTGNKRVPEDLFLEIYKRYLKEELNSYEAMELLGIKRSTWYKYCREDYKQSVDNLKTDFQQKKGT